MARYLSEAWFDELAVGAQSLGEPQGTAGDAGAGPRAGRAERKAPGSRGAGLVVEVIASGAPEGEVRYQLVMELDGPRLVSRRQDFQRAHVELRAAYATLAGIASGELSAIDALSAGLARVSGDIAALSVNQSGIGGLDLLPPAVRANTTFE
jgi:hypothetical protein